MEPTLQDIYSALTEVREMLCDKEAYEGQVLTPSAAARYTGLSRKTIANYQARHILTLTEKDGVRGYTIAQLRRVKKG